MSLLPPPTPSRKRLEKGEKTRSKSNGRKESNRILITVTVLGSAGPIRFFVREEELVSAVVGTVLKAYEREGRRPILGRNHYDFVLYHAFDGSHGLNSWEPIGSFGSRNFLLCKKQRLSGEEWQATPGSEMGKKGMGVWMAGLNRSLSLISS
ncbi:uncharacterized protein At4g22758-like [Phalaenopsis equestris]|uniref:uncharacterized protein At4g22758-like n=1 Tax=Phalaenopsis equestris TaxID=78828 RepID=UPI0009E4EFB4|nr:uncharacterized protein At4g22758-like [Phalaenopsis equestris]